jgi:hypothetical protein
MKLSFEDPRNERVEALLRAGALAFGPQPPPVLHGRIVAALARTPQTIPAARPPARERAGNWLAAAAAVLVLASTWWLAHVTARPAERAPTLVRISRDLLGAGKGVLGLPREAEGTLRLEAERLLSDTTQVARHVVRGLPAPLRARLERM